jgi:hypothetical protein
VACISNTELKVSEKTFRPKNKLIKWTIRKYILLTLFLAGSK